MGFHSLLSKDIHFQFMIMRQLLNCDHHITTYHTDVSEEAFYMKEKYMTVTFSLSILQSMRMGKWIQAHLSVTL